MITILTEREHDVTISSLLMRNAVMTDSGYYTCTADHVVAATTKVHILDGEYQAGLTVNRAHSNNLPGYLLLLVLLIFSGLLPGT